MTITTIARNQKGLRYAKFGMLSSELEQPPYLCSLCSGRCAQGSNERMRLSVTNRHV